MKTTKSFLPTYHKKMLQYFVCVVMGMIIYLQEAQALIKVPVNQRTFINSYNTQYKDLHAYFAVSHAEQGGLVQADSINTYYFSKVSEKSANRYQFVQIPHSTGIPLEIYENIFIDGYEIYGLCQYSGALDYIIGLHINSNEIRVMRIQNDTTNTQYIKDYKKVDKDDEQKKLEGGLYIDCGFKENFKGQNTYVIGIAGTYFHPNEISSYYLAKFSTKYNFTEYFALSEDPTIMEAARGVKVDFDNQMVYLAVEINKQKYFGRTVYKPGSQPGEDNANVAIHGYSWTHGVRTWTTLVGNVNYTDLFGRMQNYGNNLYVFLNSFSTQYTTNASQTDIYYYRIRASNGYIESSKIFGSSSDDKIYDLQITFTGLYLLALMNTGLTPHKENDKEWQTQDNQANLAIIWMDFDDSILDIEAFTFNNVPNPYPIKLFVPRIQGGIQTFVFLAPRTNDQIDIHGGFLITYLNNSNLIFSQNVGCGSTCSKCSPYFNSKCIQCRPGYFLLENTCYQGGCPDFSYSIYDVDNTLLPYCKECHYSCKTCSGPNSDQCSSCCQNNTCGPIYNRVPGLGKCSCPAGLFDSNGLCVQRCILNLAGKRNEMCYPTCPDNSFSEIKYDQATKAQERSQYDSASQTDCVQSSYHLRFSTNGKGLAVLGPPDFTEVPSQFTIGFWVRPITLNTNSYFINAFNRIQVKAQAATSKVFFSYKTGTSTFVDPVYTNDFKQKVVSNSWNYIVVSQKQILTNGILKYEQQLAISNSNMGTIYSGGFDNTQNVVYYPSFTNTIYIGAFSDQSPQSFTGFMKELKLFTKYHGFYQIQDEQLRMYRYYSYDDANLVAYWKLTEQFTQNDVEYVINDYSINQNQISYSRISKPDYPYFTFDQSFALSLCIFHDVSICKSPAYHSSHPYVITGKRLTTQPFFNLKDSATLTKALGDQVWFVPNNTKCTFSNALAYMTYQTNFINNWVISDTNMSPVNLKQGVHYQVCYFIAATNSAFNLYQTYLVAQPLTVDPSNGNAFMSDGVLRTWNSYEGDQGFGDVIRFSTDCSQPSSVDYEMSRTAKPTYGTHIIKNFATAGDYYFCWQPTFVQETAQPYYQAIYDLKYRIVGSPTLSTSSVTNVNMNEDMVRFDIRGTFADGDKIAFSWKGQVITDCNPTNFLGISYTRDYFQWPSVWFGYDTGISGIKNYTMDELHMCYLSAAADAPQAWSRIKKSTGSSYQVQVKEYNVTTNTKCPELVSFTPKYGSTELTESDNTIKFQFKSQQVYPSRQSDNTTFGKIAIYRGAIRPDGSILKTTDLLWSNMNLNDFLTPNPFQQGDLMCSGSGSCSITLTSQANKLKAGEIYYLSFYKESFAYKTAASSSTRNYLFNDKSLDASLSQTTAYDHLFFCRSFVIQTSNQTINGKAFVIYGTDLKYKTIRAKFSTGNIVSALFTTKSINLVLVVKNTNDQYCITTPPVATVDLQNVNQTTIMINNIELRQCNEGTLFADIEVVRGIQDKYGAFTHVRSEWQKGISLGEIGCDSSCLFCNGTSDTDCVVCANLDAKLYMGKCYSTCPAQFPYFMDNQQVIQRQLYYSHQCVSECPLGTYPDPETKECLECNEDCQTCNSNYIASCLTCEPIKYLYQGICLYDCPSPHHQNNFTSYFCDQISETKYLKVQIQSLGYKTKIPKDVQSYLKAAIQNEGGGDILSILWEQIEPEPTTDKITIFTSTTDGDLLNREAIVKLKMTAFNFMSSDQVIKVKVTVQNSVGEIAYDVYEFYQNQPPEKGVNTLWVMNNIGLGSGKAVDSIYRITLTNWLDDSAHSETPLKYKLYMIIDGNYYTLTDQFVTEEYYFRLPLLNLIQIDSNTGWRIQVCVAATDSHDAVTYACEKVYDVLNNVQYLLNRNLLVADLLQLNYTGNLTNVVFASNQLQITMDSPRRLSAAPGLCTLDYHCNYNGICSGKFGNQRCICNLGFQGTFCQFKNSQLPDLQKVSTDMILSLHHYITTKFEIKAHDIELVATTLRGVLKDPDLILDDQFEMIIQIIERVGDAPVYAHYPVTKEVRIMYLDALSSVMNKLFHSYSVKRALPETSALSKGGSLSAQYSYMEKQKRLLNYQSTSENEEQQDYLIGGIKNKNKNSMRRTLQQETTLSADIDDGTIYQQWGRRIDEEINVFINKFIPTLNPGNSKFSYSTKTFDLATYTKYPIEYKGKTMYIKEKDLYWQFPEDIFESSQGYASDKQYISLKAIKYIANPFIFESNPGGFVETNVTTITFYDLAGEHIKVDLSAQGSQIKIKEPYMKAQAYKDELLRCMAWNDDVNQFVNDGTCSASQIWDYQICVTCEEDTYIYSYMSVCRCTHLSRFAVVYQQTSPQKGVGVQIGIYSDFFAMQYWQTSLGFFAVLAGGSLFVAGHIVIFFVDRKLQPHVMEKLRERIRKLEMKGFKQKPKHKKLIVRRDDDGKIIFIKNKLFEEEQGQINQDPKKPPIESTPVTHLQKPTVAIKTNKRKIISQKKYSHEEVNEAQIIPPKGRKLGKKSSKSQLHIDTGSHPLDEEQYSTEPRLNLEQSSPDNQQRRLLGQHDRPSKGVDHDIFEQQMVQRYEEEKEAQEFVRLHGTSSSEGEDVAERMRSKEQKRYLKIEKKTRELYNYHWKTLLIHGNYITSLMYVTSFLSPRHARWTMLYTCMFLNWFWCAVIYNNTKDPLALPDFVTNIFELLQDRSARNIAGDDLWISLISPMGTIILMYVFAGLYKISDKRLNESYTSHYLEEMLIELRKEMKLRFVIAYIITIAIFAAITWYVIKFTATFGWKVSWTWWYSGCFALFFQVAVYDNLISLTHWVTYYCSRTLAIFWMKIRIMKQAKSEG